MTSFDDLTLPDAHTVRDLNVAAAHPLQTFGYEVCGDDEDGWYWNLGRHDSRRRTLAFDRIEQALYAAMLDLSEHTHGLLQAASRVICAEGNDPAALAALRAAVSALTRGLPADQR